MQMALALGLGRLRWKVTGLLLVLKPSVLVRPIAKGLACGVAATAKGDGCPPTEAVRLAFHVYEFKFPLDAQGAVIADRDFRWRHSRSFLTEKTGTLYLAINATTGR
jgi:hypothetical protein